MDVSRWVVIYPVYINSKKTLAEGRRISTSKACDNPTVVEISDCCQYLKLLCAIELDKVYSRDNMQQGHVRVQLRREDKSLVNPAVPSRKVLLMRVAELVGKLQSRHKRPEPTASTSASTAPAGKSGKGGKKKK